MKDDQGDIPLSVKLAYTAFMLVLVPVYWHDYGPQNFLWFSDLALIMLLIAVWRENALINSMAALMVLVFELGWNAAFFTGGRLHSGVDYMFDGSLPLYLRGLSLFHVFLPLMIIWLLLRLGYDRRALKLQTGFLWAVLLLSFLHSPESENINWVFGLGAVQTAVSPAVFLVFLMLAIPLVVYTPMHFLFRSFFGQPAEHRQLRVRS